LIFIAFEVFENSKVQRALSSVAIAPKGDSGSAKSISIVEETVLSSGK
jgi:hypothetical protein